jgi:Fic family protein
MTVMVELEQRVLAAQEKLSEALAELAKFSELRKGLESADESLTSAAKAIITLSEAAEKHTQNLSDASSALTAAVCRTVRTRGTSFILPIGKQKDGTDDQGRTRYSAQAKGAAPC